MASALSDIPGLLLQAAALIIGLVVHESSHALVAYLLGDRTARDRKRVSLNPLNHIDPFGTVVLPLLMMAAGGPVFAFAKPVPVYLGNLKHPQRDELLVSLAGPGSNFLLAGAGALIAHLAVAAAGWQAIAYGADGYIAEFLSYFILMNLCLGFFNLIPLPPLDGASILAPFLKGRALETYYRVQRYSMPILIAVLYLAPMVLHIDLVGIYFGYTVFPLYRVLMWAALSAA